MPVAERFEEVEGDEEIGRPPRHDQGAVLPPVDPDVALHRPAALRHPVGLGAPDCPFLDDAGLAEDVRGKNGSLAADPDDQDVERGFIAVPP